MRRKGCGGRELRRGITYVREDFDLVEDGGHGDPSCVVTLRGCGRVVTRNSSKYS